MVSFEFLGNLVLVACVRLRFFYLLDYITLLGISKCGDREKNECEPKIQKISVTLEALFYRMTHTARKLPKRSHNVHFNFNLIILNDYFFMKTAYGAG